ncbi:hypothetical protein [Bradyrhizobium paxllaeri]|uniref:hypothetical protein n=1 Tax=Bradyrhizobium paxllaeri TaxID=190148 RepID=UPI000810C024|nr:hypothetical protein [Bradyrhizobium paxllaeri]
MSDPVFGVVLRRVDEEPRPVIAADLSTIGLIGPASSADTDTFPLDTPVKVYSNDSVTLNKLGESGYLADAVNGINDQLGELDAAATLVIVRTAEGTDPDPAVRAQQTIGKIMGSSIDRTGVHAFLMSPELLAVTPRVICAPGYTGQMATSLSTLNLTQVGRGYIPGQRYDMTFTGGGSVGTVVQAQGHAIANANGEIRQSDLMIDSYGAWYTGAPNVTLPAPPAAVTATLTTAINNGAVSELVIGATGAGYVPGEVYPITFAGGGADAGKVLPTGHATADESGAIGQEQLYLDSPGANLTQPPTATIPAAPAVVTATLTAAVAAGANPVCAALPGVLNQILGHAIVEPVGTSEVADENWRETMNSQRLIPVTGGVKIMDPDTSEIVVRPLAPRVAGILVRRDKETGAPFHSAANQPVNGIVGPARAISFSLVDGDNEGQQLLANNIGILVRGETGSDFAISSGGFIFVGTDNAGDDPLWQFYNVTRGRDFIHLSLLRALRTYLGRFNISGHTVQAIVNTMNFFLRDLQAQDHILGYKVDFKGSYNSAEQIRLGHLTVGFAAEEPPVLRKITTLSARYRPAIDAMVSQLEQQLNLAA